MDVYAYYYRMSSTKTEGTLNVYGKPYQNLSITIHIAINASYAFSLLTRRPLLYMLTINCR